MLDEGLFAMQYVNSGSVTELRVNGRVLMLFPFGKKARAAIQCVTDLICLFKNLNVISFEFDFNLCIPRYLICSDNISV